MFRAFIIALWERLRRFVDRWRVRRFVRQGLPTVRDVLLEEAPPLLPPPLSLRAPDRLPPEEGSYFEAPTPSLDWLGRQSARPLLRLASTVALPPPLRPLSTLRPGVWGRSRTLGALDRTPLISAELSIARPEYFGATGERTPIEARVPPPLVSSELLEERETLSSPARLLPPLPVGVAHPESFGLSPDCTPATEVSPLLPLKPLGMARARASFLFRFTDPRSTERMLTREFHTPSETLEERLAEWFEPTTLGAGEPVEGEVDSELSSYLDEVREQFQLRRGIGRAEMDETELGQLEPLDGYAGGAIRVYSGLSFDNLQPDPVPVLRMRLENPPVDMSPSIEAPTDALKALMHAFAEFPPDGSPPPVPTLPER